MALDVHVGIFFPGRLALYAVLIKGVIWRITSLQAGQGKEKKKKKQNAKANTKRSLAGFHLDAAAADDSNQSKPAGLNNRETPSLYAHRSRWWPVITGSGRRVYAAGYCDVHTQ